MALTKVSGDILDTGIVVAGVTTSTNFKTGTSNLHNVGIEIAGINVLGADTPIGAGVTIYNSGGADFTGVVTATRFVGQADISGGSITATTGTFSGDVSIGGTLTYQDVTNVDSTGIATARVGLDILSGGLNIVGLTTGLHVSGVSTFTGAINGNLTGNVTVSDSIIISEDDAIHFKGTAADDLDAILRQSAGGGQLLINSRHIAKLNIDSNNDSTDAYFAIGHGTATGANASTDLLRVHESGVVNIGDRSDNSWIDSTLKVRKDQNAVTKIAVRNENQGSSASSAIAVNAYGNSWMFDCGSAAKNSNALTIRVDATANSNQGTEKLRIDTGGRVLLNTITEGHGNADDLTIATAASGSLGNTGITIRSGTSNDGNIFFSDATSGGGETIGGIKYTHGGAGSNAETLNFIANGLTRATVSATAFWVDDGTNARLKLAPDSANLNMIISTTTGNGSYCNLLYGAADHIFKYGGNETARLSTAGNYTITGEFASAQDYPTIRPTLDLNFAATKTLDPRITYYRTGPASYVDEFGKIVLVGDNVPRFDHNPTTRECKGLLIEESRTNYVRQSLTLATDWSAGSGSYGYDAAITNPDGSVGAYYHTGAELYHQNIDLSGASTNVAIISMWVKARSGQTGVMDIEMFQQISGGAVSMGAFTVNPITGAITTGGARWSDGTVTEYPNGWYRFSAKATTASGNFTSSARLDIQNNEHYVWGMQVEVGSFVTSFIPTNGTTATRGADFALIDGEEFTDFFNQDEGTINCAYWLGNDSVGLRVFQINDSNNSVIDIVAGSGSGSGGYGYVNTGGTAQANAGQSSANASRLNTLHVTTLAYKANDVAGINIKTGVLTNDTSATLDGAYNRVTFYQGANGGDQLNGHLQRVQYYPKRLPDNQLKNLNNQ